MMEMKIEGELPSLKDDFTKEMETISRMMLESVQQNFLEGGRPDKWKPLKTGEERRLIGKTEALYRSGRNAFGKNFAEVTWGAGLPYAAIQHFGGVTHPTVTEKSQRYFWAMYYASGKKNEMWKWLALKPIGTKLNITIPASPYMMFQEQDIEKYVEILGSALFKITEPKLNG
jgi:phage gpG-like protein